MPSMGHLYRWSLYSEQKAKIMKNRIQSLNYSSYISGGFIFFSTNKSCKKNDIT